MQILDNARTVVNAVDECENIWTCIMIFGTTPDEHCRIGGQLKRFVEARNLYEGVRLRIGAPIDGDKETIYVTVVEN